MSKRIAILYVGLVLALVWVGFAYVKSLGPTVPLETATTSGGGSMRPGNPVADFVLPSESGQRIKLTDYKGQIVALVFYASW